MIRYAKIDEAKHAVVNWNGLSDSVVHIGDHGNSIFLFENCKHEKQILRFTDPHFRTCDEVSAELEFVNHLHAEGAKVAKAIASIEGKFFLTASCESGNLICSSIAFASGLEVLDSSEHWNKDLFFAWGRNLGEIHRASAKLTTIGKRWQWDKEILFAQADQLIPKSDLESRNEFAEVMALCQDLEKTQENFGLIHADHAPQNFRYEPLTNKITAFDFGNCCYHWFVADLAISLSTVRRKSNRDEIRNEILEGYSSVYKLPPLLDEKVNLFIRLRVIYVYLSRLHMWSANQTEDQMATLTSLRERVHSKMGWS